MEKGENELVEETKQEENKTSKKEEIKEKREKRKKELKEKKQQREIERNQKKAQKELAKKDKEKDGEKEEGLELSKKAKRAIKKETKKKKKEEKRARKEEKLEKRGKKASRAYIIVVLLLLIILFSIICGTVLFIWFKLDSAHNENLRREQEYLNSQQQGETPAETPAEIPLTVCWSVYKGSAPVCFRRLFSGCLPSETFRTETAPRRPAVILHRKDPNKSRLSSEKIISFTATILSHFHVED